MIHYHQRQDCLVHHRHHGSVVQGDALVDLFLLDGGQEHPDRGQAVGFLGLHRRFHVLGDAVLERGGGGGRHVGLQRQSPRALKPSGPGRVGEEIGTGTISTASWAAACCARACSGA